MSILESVAQSLGDRGPPEPDSGSETDASEMLVDEERCSLWIEDFLACRSETVGRAMLNAETHECRGCNRQVDEHPRKPQPAQKKFLQLVDRAVGCVCVHGDVDPVDPAVYSDPADLARPNSDPADLARPSSPDPADTS
uniref:Uncharacterized protein n=1 Tax=Marseillevirus LCMAC103 TaxID=2506604 RepID=A0A481YUF0_9VIRU|nr:MAG: hypothetical protein LCMAC103_01340 [Marseillevirus LCMAC103]